MQKTERKMNRGWAFVAAFLAGVVVLLDVRYICGWYPVVVYEYLHAIAFVFLAVCFIRQKVDGVLIAAFLTEVIFQIAYDFGLYGLLSGSWHMYRYVTATVGDLIPVVLLAFCCGKKDEGKTEKGTQIVLILSLLGVVLELLVSFLSRLLGRPQLDELTEFYFMQEVPTLFYLVAFYAIKKTTKTKSEDALLESVIQK